MIARNETFYQVVPAHPSETSSPPTRTAAARWGATRMRYWLVMPAAGAGAASALTRPSSTPRSRGAPSSNGRSRPFLGTHAARASWWPLAPRMSTGERLPRARGRSRRWGVLSAARPCAVRSRASPGSAAAGLGAGARCGATLLDAQDLERLLTRLAAHPVGGVLAVRVADTSSARSRGVLRRTAARSRQHRSAPACGGRSRRRCFAMERCVRRSIRPTPRSARRAMRRRHSNGWGAAAVDRRSGNNLKVTTAEDLVLAAAILRARHG